MPALLARTLDSAFHQGGLGNEVLANGGTMFAATEFSSADGLKRRTEPVLIRSFLGQLLDRGEASVVQLAINAGIETVCIDENLVRRVARLNGLRVTASLEILIRAKRAEHSLCNSDVERPASAFSDSSTH